MVTLHDARSVARMLATTIHPLQVIVFGSVAKAGRGNDLDLLIIVQDTAGDVGEIHSKLYHSLKNFYRQFDIESFIISVSTFRRYFFEDSPFLKMIVNEGRCLYMKNARATWIKDANEELDIAECLFENEYYRGTCYHAQQCLEKTIKAALLGKGWELEKSHNFGRLVAIARDYHIDISITEDDLIFMDSIYRGRYPGEVGLLPLGIPQKIDGERALRIAKEIFESLQK